MIAFDASATGLAVASSLTYSHTCTGSDRILLVNMWCGASRTISSITYNGVTMTELANLALGGGERNAVYYLVAPATGANNVVITLSGSATIVGLSNSYTGVLQATPIDASRTETGLDTGTTYAEAITSVADNCWSVWFSRQYAGGTTTAGADTVLRASEFVTYGAFSADSNAAITPAGSRTMNMACTISGNWFTDILATLAPSTSAVNTTNFFVMM